MRINKYLAWKNVSTRRGADEIVKAGHVRINGRLAILGDKVEENDKVTVLENTRKKKRLVYYAFNKPKGIATHSPQKGEPGIKEAFKFPEQVFPLGRLDKDSHGLLILTNDGRITDRLLSPEYYHEKEYVVRVAQDVSPDFIAKMSKGVRLEDGYITRACSVKKINKFSFSIILTEGKKHQIRRMCEKLGRTVTDLRRERVINIKLGNLKPGSFRNIEGKELESFFKAIDMDDQAGKIDEKIINNT